MLDVGMFVRISSHRFSAVQMAIHDGVLKSVRQSDNEARTSRFILRICAEPIGRYKLVRLSRVEQDNSKFGELSTLWPLKQSGLPKPKRGKESRKRP